MNSSKTTWSGLSAPPLKQIIKFIVLSDYRFMDKKCDGKQLAAPPSPLLNNPTNNSPTVGLISSVMWAG